jgi:putative hemolysin
MRHAARDISYSHSASTRGGRAVIRLLENATGRVGLIRRARGYETEVAAGRDFWQVMVDRYGLRLEIMSGSLANLPPTGPLIAIANHPYGILDGLMLGHILSVARGDFRILAHQVFQKARELEKVVLPVDFAETKEAVQRNLDTRSEALAYLSAGGCVGVFPGGTVSTAARPFAHPMDPGWRAFTARMIARSNATVVPIYFDGHTSRLFQLASHLHVTLRMGLLIQEFRKRIDTPVRIAIGEPVPRSEIDARTRNPREMMDFLRETTYALSPVPLQSSQYGFEFIERHMRPGQEPRRRY